MTKKILVITLILVMSFALASCSRGQVEATYTKETPLVIKCGDSDSKDMSSNVFFYQFKEEVEKESEGRISVEVYPNSQLGDDIEMIKGIQMGTVQMVITTGAVASVVGDAASLPSLPFVFKTYEDWRKAWNGEALTIYNKILTDTNSNLYVPCVGYSGPYCILSRDKCFESVDDLKGFKVRVIPTDLNLKFWKALGAAPTPMSYGDVYTALNQGTIDGMDHTSALFWAGKFAEVAKYVTYTEHQYSAAELVVQKKWYENLPEDLKKIIDNSISKFPGIADGFLTEVNIPKLLEDDFGCTISYPSEQMREEMIKACEAVYDLQRNSSGKEAVDAYLKLGQQ